MADLKKIKTALVSVFDKDNLEPIIKKLHAEGVRLLSTGGTQKFIEAAGVPCDAVEDLTGYPSILGGRVKTLHPKVFGGILARRDNAGDNEQTKQYEIPEIDLVIVDLYPFEKTVDSGATEQEIIEKIDIGGISLIRAAAKNYKDVVIVASKAQYAPLQNIFDSRGAETTLAERKAFARDAFGVSSHYDAAIFGYFDKDNETGLRYTADKRMSLRYGENPHQAGAFFGDFDQIFTQIQGKEISYNNLLDIDAAVNLMEDFRGTTTFAILKHNNACGVATRDTLLEAWTDALAGDPVSAFGGVLITNKPLDAATATEIDKLFYEVLIAPAYAEDALKILTENPKRKNRIILIKKDVDLPRRQLRTALNGVLVQEKDLKTEQVVDFKVVTEKAPTEAEVMDLIFANKLVKHTKSNTIVFAKGGQLYASGVGQTSRVDACRQAIEKAATFGFDLHGAVMASDAFFPFPDCVELAHQAGVTAVVQPGGSIKDQLSVDYCNEHGIAMVMTGSRHFKH